MATNKKKLLEKVTAVSEALDDLESKLEPLFAQSLPETLNSLEPLQQAKLQVVLPYLINDLIFIYLRTRGVDPKTHPVVAELERVRQYFSKIKNAEEAETKRRLGVDKAAAGRFIKHAIAQAKQQLKTPQNEEEDRQEGPSSAAVPLKVTKKMHEREQYLKELKEADEASDEDDDVLDVIDDPGECGNEAEGIAKGKGVDKLVDEDSKHSGPKKRRMPMDPFAGVGEETLSPGPPKKSKKLAQMIEATPLSRASSVSLATADSDVPPSDQGKKKRKRKRASLAAIS